MDTYIHRAGRTGRAGKQGICLTFFNKKTIGLLERIEKIAKFKFKKIGAPQPKDLIEATLKDLTISLKSVTPTVLDNFR